MWGIEESLSIRGRRSEKEQNVKAKKNAREDKQENELVENMWNEWRGNAQQPALSFFFCNQIWKYFLKWLQALGSYYVI